MSSSFAALQERLLEGGIAPRHVKRYLRELTEHLADLAEAQRAGGLGEADAAAAARAALGPDADLADAMLKQRDFRSLSARFPWLVFAVVPPLALFAGFFLWVFVVVMLGIAVGMDPAHGKIPAPGWYAGTAGVLVLAANFLATPLLAFLLAWMAQRQRMNLLWPLLGMALILLLNMHGMVTADARNFSIGGGNVLRLSYNLSHSKGPFHPPDIFNWPAFLGQAMLLCVPVIWLLWMRRKAAAA